MKSSTFLSDVLPHNLCHCGKLYGLAHSTLLPLPSSLPFIMEKVRAEITSSRSVELLSRTGYTPPRKKYPSRAWDRESNILSACTREYSGIGKHSGVNIFILLGWLLGGVSNPYITNNKQQCNSTKKSLTYDSTFLLAV